MFVAQSLGLQIAPTGGKNLSRPFPCMFSRCGCQSAEQCWRGCCCQSLSERLAWARKNNVEPPAFVLERTADDKPVAANEPAKAGDDQRCCEIEIGDPQDRDANNRNSKKSCCSKVIEKCPPSRTAKSDAAKCAASKSAPGQCCKQAGPVSKAVASKAVNSQAVAPAMDIFRCHGAGGNWIGLGPTLVPLIVDRPLVQPLIAWMSVESNRSNSPHASPLLRPPAA